MTAAATCLIGLVTATMLRRALPARSRNRTLQPPPTPRNSGPAVQSVGHRRLLPPDGLTLNFNALNGVPWV